MNPSLSHFIIFTLILTTFSFAIHALHIPHLPQVLPPLTIYTQIELWVCFSGLAATVFHNKLPEVFRYAIQPVLVAGAILCVAFVISLVPAMLLGLFGLLLYGPLAGLLVLLIYSPVFALIAFVRSARKIHNSVTEKRISTWLIGGTITIILSYSILYKIQWDRAQEFVYEEDLKIQKLDEQEVSAGRGRLSTDDIRFTQYQRNVETFRWMRNGENQCKRAGISQEVCPFVNSLLSVEECIQDHGCNEGSIF
ncbi:hypothetical protein [Leptospira mayottensis]|uniref:Uncharacterized protein n=1 Tax=Leptospira mayottensis 200901122 TaxID=1193010 RepID=A0AA87MP06_9LEPT|nr:hypothetical protein [Leptospira mayottensis]EKS00642.1 hypothetical protein LEP1GSC125_1463 [Leptospira mayottensis 200901122]